MGTAVGFDPTSAKPVGSAGGFDPSTAKPFDPTSARPVSGDGTSSIPITHTSSLSQVDPTIMGAINAAVKKYPKVTPEMLLGLGEVESGLGKSGVYDPVTGLSKTPGNNGHGIWQLDPSSGASAADLERAAHDPYFAAERAAQMIQDNLGKYGGDEHKAVAAYNAGTPDSSKGQAYADRVAAAKRKYGNIQADLEDGKEKRQHSALESFFNALDVPFFMVDALTRGGQPYTNFPQAKYVWDKIREGKVNEVAEHYNLMSPDQLKDEAKHGDTLAGWFLTHSLAAAGADFVAELANPTSLATGEVIGRAFKAAFDLAQKNTFARGALNLFSPFMHVAMAAGEEGKQAVGALANRIASVPAEAYNEALSIFKGLSKVEQAALYHLNEAKVPPNMIKGMKGIDPARMGELRKRATKLAEYRRDVMNTALNHHIVDTTDANFNLPKGRIEQSPADNIQGSGVGHGFGKYKEEPDESLATIQKRGNVDPNWSPAVAIGRWAASKLRRVDLDVALERLPQTLMQPKPAGLKAPFNLANMPKGKDGIPLIPWELAKEKFPELKFVDSPRLKDSLIHPAMAKYLAENSTLLFDDKQLYFTGGTFKDKLLNNMVLAWNGLSNANRIAIIVNPIIHPAFNLANNAMAAGVPPWEIATLVSKSIVASFGGAKLLDRWLPQSQEFTRYLQEGLAEGASAELKQGDTRLLASKWSDLDTVDKVKKVFAEAGAWNARGTFGKYGEQAFMASMLRNMMKSGRYTRPEAIQLIREALGNYQNINKNPKSLDGMLNMLLFFYPWLKGNMAYWVRKLGTAPQYVAAPAQAMRANNQLVDDPSEYDPKHPEPAKDFQFILPDGHGGYTRNTPILPQRMVADASIVASWDPNKIVNKMWDVVTERLQPTFKVLADTAKTAIAGPSSPLDPRDFDTMYSKNAPTGVQWREWTANAAGELAPIPLVKYIWQQGLSRGVSPEEMKDKLFGAASGDFIYSELSKSQQIGLHHAMSNWTKRVQALNKNLSPDERQRRLLKFYVQYDNTVRNIIYHTGDKKAQWWQKPIGGG